jgi:dCMP deaminase
MSNYFDDLYPGNPRKGDEMPTHSSSSNVPDGSPSWSDAAAKFEAEMAEIPYPHERPTWAETFKGMLDELARRATCHRLQTASMVVDEDHRILGMGYNGAPKGMPHCIEVGCLMENGHCVRTVHDTANALARVNPRDAKGSRIYQLHRPCIRCVQLMINYEIRYLFYWGTYNTDDASVALRLAGDGGITVYSFGDGDRIPFVSRSLE